MKKKKKVKVKIKLIKHRRKQKPEEPAEVIFDSTKPSTDSLFVGNLEEELKNFGAVFCNEIASSPEAPRNDAEKIFGNKSPSLRGGSEATDEAIPVPEKKKKGWFRNLFGSMLIGLIFAGLFSAVFYVFALPYAPGEITNPTCLPTDANCTVISSVPYTGATTAVDLGAKNFTTTGSGSFSSLTLTTSALTVGNGGTGLGAIAAGSILGANTASVLTAITSTSGTKILTNTDGTITWATAASGLPDQTGNNGKYLTTNGSAASWGTVDLSGYLTGVTASSPLSGAGTAVSPLVLSTSGTWSGNAVTATTASSVTNATFTTALTVNGGTGVLTFPASGTTTLTIPTSGGTLGTAAFTASSAYQAANANLTSIAGLANSAGWLHNNGSGTFAYSTPSASDVGLSAVTNNRQIPGLSTGTTSGHLVTWGADGYTVADGGAVPTGTVTGTGTANQLAYWSSASALTGGTGLTYDGTTLTAGTGTEVLTVLATGQVGISNTSPGALLDIGTAGTTAGVARLEGATSGYTAIAPNASAITSYTMTLPATAGTSGQTMTTDGSGNMSWTTINGGSGAANGVAYWSATNTLASSVAGTSGQALISGGAGAPTWYAPTLGSVLFAGASGILSQDNSGFFYNSTSHSLGLGVTAFGTSAATVLGIGNGTAPSTSITGTQIWSTTAGLNIMGSGQTGVITIPASASNGTLMTNPMTAVGDIIYGGASGAPTTLVAGTTGQILQSNTGAAPSWSTATYPSTGGTVNTLLVSNGTNFVNTANLTFDGTNLQVSGAGSSEILSTNAPIILGETGGTNTNNEQLKFDFDTAIANKVAVSSDTGVSLLDFGTINLNSGGYIAGNPIVTSVVASGAPATTPADGALIVDSGDGGRIYFRYASAWHYVAQTGGFQIPTEETVDSVSGDQMKEGDIVLGMLNQTFNDGALHGIWVKWDSVKAQLLSEAKSEILNDGTLGTGSVEGVQITTLSEKITNVLTSLGISIKDGMTSIANLAVEKSTTDVARIKKMEMVDSDTGDIYCTWVKDGEWVKIKGDCGSLDAANVSAQPSPVDETAQQLAAAAQQAQQIVQNSQEQIAQSANDTVSQAQDQIEQQLSTTQNTINSVASIADITVANGIALADAGLPATITVTLGDASTKDLAIVWDGGTPTYDPTTAGTYAFAGELTLQDNVLNGNNLTATCNVIVQAPPPPEEVPPPENLSPESGEVGPQQAPSEENPGPASLLSGWIKKSAQNLLNAMWEFLNGMFNLGMKKASSVPVIKNSTASLSLPMQNLWQNTIKLFRK